MGDRGDTVRPRQLADEEARPVRREESLRGGEGEETQENERKLREAKQKEATERNKRN